MIRTIYPNIVTAPGTSSRQGFMSDSRHRRGKFERGCEEGVIHGGMLAVVCLLAFSR